MSAISSTNPRNFDSDLALNDILNNPELPLGLKKVLRSNEDVIKKCDELYREFRSMSSRVISAEEGKELLIRRNKNLRQRLIFAKARSRIAEKELKSGIKKAEKRVQEKAGEVCDSIQKVTEKVEKINKMFEESERKRKALEQLFKVQNDLGCKVEVKRTRRK